MTVELRLRCSGPDGPTNGCQEGHVGFFAVCEDSHNSVKDAWAGLRARAVAAGWSATINQNRMQCAECAAHGAYTIAGFPMEVWEKAMSLYLDGLPPSEWGSDDGLPSPRQWNNMCNSYPEFGKRRQASPLWVERTERADPVRPEIWAEVERRILNGEEKRDVCIGRHGWPTSAQWEVRMATDERFYDLVTAERGRRRAAAEAKVDEALQAFETGAGVYLSDLLDGATRNRWWKRMQEDPGFAARVARARERNFLARTVDRLPLYEAALEQYASGVPTERLRRKSDDRVTLANLHSMVGYDAAFAARFDRAMAMREKALNDARGRRGKLASERVAILMTLDWDGAIEDIQWGEHITQALAKPNRPTMSQWNYRRRKDQGFAQAADDAIEIRKVVREELRSTKEQELAKVRAQAGDTIGSRLKDKLGQNDLFAAVNRCVPVGLPPHIRDDVVGAMILAVLEGEMSLDQVPKKARDFMAAYHKEAGTYANVSIDAPIAGTDDLKLIDTLTEAHTWRLRE